MFVIYAKFIGINKQKIVLKCNNMTIVYNYLFLNVTDVFRLPVTIVLYPATDLYPFLSLSLHPELLPST